MYVWYMQDNTRLQVYFSWYLIFVLVLLYTYFPIEFEKEIRNENLFFVFGLVKYDSKTTTLKNSNSETKQFEVQI